MNKINKLMILSFHEIKTKGAHIYSRTKLQSKGHNNGRIKYKNAKRLQCFQNNK